DLTALYADHGGRGRRVQPSAEDPRPFRLQLAVERIDVGEGPPHLLGRRELLALDVVHGQHVLLHDPPPSWFRHPTGRFTLLRCRLRVLAPCRPRTGRDAGPSRRRRGRLCATPPRCSRWPGPPRGTGACPGPRSPGPPADGIRRSGRPGGGCA